MCKGTGVWGAEDWLLQLGPRGVAWEKDMSGVPD